MYQRARQSRFSRRHLVMIASGAIPALQTGSAKRSLALQTPSATPMASPTVAGPELHVSRTNVQVDESFDIRVTGLQSLQEVEISSSFTDFWGYDWAAEGRYIADLDGTLFLNAQPPAEGTFDVPDTMALIWSAATRTSAFYSPTLYGQEVVTISLSADGRHIGDQSISRTILPAGGSPTVIGQPDLVAEFREPGPGWESPAPAVIVLGGSEGGISTQLISTLMASHGYAVLSVAYFGIGNLPPQMERIPLEYFSTAISWVMAHPSVRRERIGVMGFSRGGELALLLGAHYPEISAVVSYNGSGLVVPAPLVSPPIPAWTWQGEDLPFATSDDPEEYRPAEIRVERTRGPILLISGDADQLWPSTFLAEVAMNRLQRFDHPWASQHLSYPGAGHGINPPFMPTTPRGQIAGHEFGGDPLSDHLASVHSWRAVLNMLDWRLRAP